MEKFGLASLFYTIEIVTIIMLKLGYLQRKFHNNKSAQLNSTADDRITPWSFLMDVFPHFLNLTNRSSNVRSGSKLSVLSVDFDSHNSKCKVSCTSILIYPSQLRSSMRK